MRTAVRVLPLAGIQGGVGRGLTFAREAEDIASVDPWIAMEEMPRDRNSEFRPGRKSMRQLRDEVLAGDFSVSPRALKRRPECGSCHD